MDEGTARIVESLEKICSTLESIDRTIKTKPVPYDMDVSIDYISEDLECLIRNMIRDAKYE